jgi:hypothetical protein
MEATIDIRPPFRARIADLLSKQRVLNETINFTMACLIEEAQYSPTVGAWKLSADGTQILGTLPDPPQPLELPRKPPQEAQG